MLEPRYFVRFCLAAAAYTCVCGLALPVTLAAARVPTVTFHAAPAAVVVNDFCEITISVERPTAANPFTDVTIVGEFRRQGGKPIHVDGFCDAADGRLFRIRFMPCEPGRYDYTVLFRQGGNESSHKGSFTAVAKRRKGVLRVDPERPEHFIWQGTGEHCFRNGTTTYYLMGWDDETIRSSIDRLAEYRINRLRVLRYARRVRRRSRQRRTRVAARIDFVYACGLGELPIARSGLWRQPHRPHGRYAGQSVRAGLGRGKEG